MDDINGANTVDIADISRGSEVLELLVDILKSGDTDWMKYDSPGEEEWYVLPSLMDVAYVSFQPRNAVDIGVTQPRMSMYAYDPAPQPLRSSGADHIFYDDFDEGIHGWSELIGNYEHSA